MNKMLLTLVAFCVIYGATAFPSDDITDDVPPALVQKFTKGPLSLDDPTDWETAVMYTGTAADPIKCTINACPAEVKERYDDFKTKLGMCQSPAPRLIPGSDKWPGNFDTRCASFLSRYLYKACIVNGVEGCCCLSGDVAIDPNNQFGYGNENYCQHCSDKTKLQDQKLWVAYIKAVDRLAGKNAKRVVKPDVLRPQQRAFCDTFCRGKYVTPYGCYTDAMFKLTGSETFNGKDNRGKSLNVAWQDLCPEISFHIPAPFPLPGRPNRLVRQPCNSDTYNKLPHCVPHP